MQVRGAVVVQGMCGQYDWRKGTRNVHHPAVAQLFPEIADWPLIPAGPNICTHGIFREFLGLKNFF